MLTIDFSIIFVPYKTTIDMTTNSEKREKILNKIKNLLSKTIDNGCTEAEAISASEKVSELLNEYDISMTEIEAKNENFITDNTTIDSSIKKPIHSLIYAIARLTDTTSWFSKKNKKFQYFFFGMEKDVQSAKFLFNLLSTSMDNEYLKFKKTPEYKLVNGRTARTSFYYGITTRLNQRLFEMKDITNQTNQEQGLILYNKAQIVKEKFNSLHLRLKSEKKRSVSSNVDLNSFLAGKKAGDNVNIRKTERKELSH